MITLLSILRLFVCCFPTIIFTTTTAFPRTPLRRLSSSQTNLYHSETNYVATLNSTTAKEPTIRDVVGELITKKEKELQESEPPPHLTTTVVDPVAQNDFSLHLLIAKNDLSTKGDRAIRHLHRILDMYNTSSYGCLNNLNSKKIDPQLQFSEHQQMVTVKTMEGVLRKLLASQRTTIENGTESPSLEDLQDLIDRCDRYNIILSLNVLENMWELLIKHHERQVEQEIDPMRQTKRTRRHVGRCVRLLNIWIKWSSDTTSKLSSPPAECVEYVFFAAKDAGMSMTSNMWKLYQQQTTLPTCQTFSRNHFRTILSILSTSPSPWREKQVVVLKHLEGFSQISKLESFSPTIPELELALDMVSAAGLAQDASWLYNLLDERCNHGDRSAIYLNQWMRSICNDGDMEGSLLYLEHILLRSESNLSERLRDRRFYNSYLEKLAHSKLPDAGARAEVFFLEWQHQSDHYLSSSGDSWHPNEDSVRAVAMAYLQAEGPKEVQLAEARRFLAKHVVER
jgi:hypothetical protein